MSNQKQASGDNSVNIQAQGNVVVQQGISATEARQIAIDVMKVTALEYQREAQQLIESRINSISEKMIEEVGKKTKSNFDSFKDPDFQYVLNQAGVTYARTGDANIEMMIVDLIGERAAERARTTKQTILNEALGVGAKLTNDHLKILAVIFIPKYTVRYVGNLKELGDYCSSTMAGPLLDFSVREIDFQHLAYLGCVTLSSLGTSSLEKIFRTNYSGLITNGFLENEIPQGILNVPATTRLIIPCLRDTTRRQFNAMNEKGLTENLDSLSISADDKKKAIALHNKYVPNERDVKALLISQAPNMEIFFNRWKESVAQRAHLTSVGRALAISYLRSQGETTYSFDTWLG